MLKKFWFDIQYLSDKKPIYDISKRLNEQILEYPFIFNESQINSGQKQRLISGFDNNGIPLNNPYVDVEGGTQHYYPITIGQVGLSVYQTYLNSNSETDKNRFLKFADWFMKHKLIDKNYIFWLTEIPKPEYKIFNPWKSAFTQSRAISILIRAFIINQDEELLKTIELALNLFELNYDQGGVSVKTANGLFYEEYPATEPTMVLDGHLFSLFAFIDLLKIKNDLPESIRKKSQSLFNLGIQGAIDKLPEYDMGFWLRFNLCEMQHYPAVDPCTISYMKLIKLQLDVLNSVSSQKLFLIFSEKISNYLQLFNFLKATILKYQSLKKLNRL